jgi:hypothetical protein
MDPKRPSDIEEWDGVAVISTKIEERIPNDSDSGT